MRGRPLESSGQAGKEKFLDLFSPSIGSLWPYLLVNRYAPKNLLVWCQLICTSHPSELRRLSVATGRYRRPLATASEII